jgi:hypothetical protein
LDSHSLLIRLSTRTASRRAVRNGTEGMTRKIRKRVAAAVVLRMGLMYSRTLYNTIKILTAISRCTLPSFCWLSQRLARQVRSRIGPPRLLCDPFFLGPHLLCALATLEDGGHVSHCRVTFDHRLRLLSTLCDGLFIPGPCHLGEKYWAKTRERDQVHDFGIGRPERSNITSSMNVHGTLNAVVLAANEAIFNYFYNDIFLPPNTTLEIHFGRSEISLLVHASPCRSLTSTRRVLLEHCVASPFTQSIVNISRNHQYLHSEHKATLLTAVFCATK